MKLLKKLSAVAVVVILVIGASYFLFKTEKEESLNIDQVLERLKEGKRT